MQLVSRFYQVSAEGFQLALTALHDIAGQGAGDVFILLAHDAVVNFLGKGWREGDAQPIPLVCLTSVYPLFYLPWL